MSNVDNRDIVKINGSYSVDHKGNIEQTIHEVEMVTGLPIDRYAITTFEGFEQAIDAIGGVEMDVPYDLQYSDPYQDLEIDTKPANRFSMANMRCSLCASVPATPPAISAASAHSSSSLKPSVMNF